ncbi:uncharacterized protein LOC142329496 [Lycorma delicatula]|uniref:uncharacterized protein LOC142329496 n=1 Tax=Lycorma delicatula TaxID=130591 RepID=UPI003F5183D6
MPKMKNVVEQREKIPRKAKSSIIGVEEINMIKEVLQKERDLERISKKKEKMYKKNCLKKSKIGKTLCSDKPKQIISKHDIVIERICENDTETINDVNSGLYDRLKESGLSHFMDLEERKDLLGSNGDDPLCINGPETYDAIDWVAVKTEVPDDIEVSRVTITEIPLKTDEPKMFSSLPISSSPVSLRLSPLLKVNDSVKEQSNLEKKDNSTVSVDDSSKILNSDNNDGDNCLWNDSPDHRIDDSDKEADDFKMPPKEKPIKRKCRPHNCDICGKKLSSKGSLRIHKKKKHQIKMTFNCELCSLSFELQRDLIKHRNEAHRDKDGRFMCQDCNKICNDYRVLLAHIKSHYEEGEILRNLNGNCSTNAGNVGFKCEECHKMFKSEAALEVHRTSIHNSDGEILKAPKKKFICPTCGKRFAFSCLLRDHVNLHTGTKPYLCQICGRSFAQKASLKQHARTHNPVRPFECNVCPQGFFGKGDLKKHMRKHTGERPYVCEMCGDGFSQSSHLGVHRRSHTGERPFKCDICSRGFTKKGDVVRHRRIHTGELPYLCQVCGKAFRQSTQCANHIKDHHPDAVVGVSKNPAPVAQWTFYAIIGPRVCSALYCHGSGRVDPYVLSVSNDIFNVHSTLQDYTYKQHITTQLSIKGVDVSSRRSGSQTSFIIQKTDLCRIKIDTLKYVGQFILIILYITKKDMTELCKDKFDNICRLCSSLLTATKHEICGKLGLSNIIDECLQIKVHKDDNLPQYLCENCLILLQNLSTFRTSCYDTQTKLLACLKLNGDTEEHKSSIKPEQDAAEQESAGEPQSTISSDTDDVEIKENGIEKLPELSEPGSEDYVLMKEETFSLEANRENRNLPGILSDNFVEFNNNSTNNNNNNVNNTSTSEKDRDVIDGQRLRKDILAPMWDVFEKIWPRNESANGEKTMIRVVHRRYVVSKLAFPCSLCGECFKFDQGYERGGTPEIRPYDCNTCGKVFPRRSSWKRHQATHEDVKPFQCRVCGKGFNRKEHLSRHLLLHGAVKPFSCERCGKFFTRNEHLNRHLQVSPMCWDGSSESKVGVRPHSCQSCGQSFIRKEHLTRHMKRAHDIDLPEGETEPRPFSCPTCNKTFTRREHLRRHQAIHQKDMPMDVQQAEEVQCSPQIDAVSHMSEDNPTPSPPNSPEERKPEEQRSKKPTVVTCHICSKGFSRRSHLSRHLRQVHKVCPEGSEEVHRCNECGKDFGRRYHLERHAKIHMNTTYECVTCGEKFTESEALDKHMTVHGNTVLENFLWM